MERKAAPKEEGLWADTPYKRHRRPDGFSEGGAGFGAGPYSPLLSWRRHPFRVGFFSKITPELACERQNDAPGG